MISSVFDWLLRELSALIVTVGFIGIFGGVSLIGLLLGCELAVSF